VLLCNWDPGAGAWIRKESETDGSHYKANPGIGFAATSRSARARSAGEGIHTMTIAERELEQPLEHEIDPSVQEELLRHPGKWAAITRSEVIAIADTPSAALKEARAHGHESPILYFVPEGSTSYFF
jgi:hypothetical protein